MITRLLTAFDAEAVGRLDLLRVTAATALTGLDDTSGLQGRGGRSCIHRAGLYSGTTISSLVTEIRRLIRHT